MKTSPWRARLEALDRRGLSRAMRVVGSPHGPVVETPDGPKLMFCSNDYLGLGADPRMAAALAAGASRWGVGAGGSRLISGNTAAHEALEARFARFAGSEASVLFPSGYQANVGVIPALTREGDRIFCDELTHASIVDGCRLSRASVNVYRHGDTGHLRELVAGRSGGDGLRLIITDAVFSMDGDEAPLADIAAIAGETDSAVYVDEAHSAGLVGPGGRGLTAALGLEAAIAVRVFPLGKAFGAAGAMVACDGPTAGVLRSRARSLLYTTGSPAALAEAITAGIGLLEAADGARSRIADNVSTFKELAAAAGIPALPSITPIQPIVVGGSERTMEISRLLWEDGLFVQGIRPPTVREGASRLRVTLCAFHGEDHIRRLVSGVADALERTG